MKGDPEERAAAVGRYIVESGATVRAAVAVALSLGMADKINRGHIVLLHVFDHSKPL